MPGDDAALPPAVAEVLLRERRQRAAREVQGSNRGVQKDLAARVPDPSVELAVLVDGPVRDERPQRQESLAAPCAELDRVDVLRAGRRRAAVASAAVSPEGTDR